MRKALFLALTILCVSALYAQPSNDNCSNATNISSGLLDNGNGSCVSLNNQTTVNATEWTIPPGVTFTGNCWNGADTLQVVFYSFTAQGVSGSVDVLNGPDDFYVSVIEFNGAPCDGTNITEWGCGANAMVMFDNQLTVGTTYYIVVAFANNTEGTFDLCVFNPPPAPNDLCVNAINLPALDGTPCNSGLNNYYPSSEGFTPGCFPADASPSVWYSFTAQGVSIADLHIQGAPDNAHVAIWDFNGGTTCDLITGTVLSCQSNVTSANPLSADNVLVPGNTYYAQVGFSNSATGDFDICLNAPAQAFNDDCMQAASYPTAELSNPNGCLSDIGGQNLNSDWPSNDIVAPACWDNAYPQNLWFEFTAQGPDVDVSVNPSFGANEQIALVQFAAGNTCLPGNATVLACSAGSDLNYENGLTPGETYYVMVGFDTDQTGDYCINIYNPLPPPNDVPCQATSIVGSACLNSTTVNANPDFPPGSFPPECAANLENTTWFTIQLSDPDDVGFEITVNEITGQDFAVVIGTFNDCNGTFFTEAIECSQNFPLSFGPVTDPGQVYYVMVGSSEAGAGEFEFCVDMATPCFTNNNCGTAEPIMGLVPDGGFVCVEGCNLWASPYTGSSVCGLDGNPVVWYAFQAGANATSINVNLESSDIAAPVVALLEGDCTTGLHSVNTSNGDPCAAGSGGSTSATFDIMPGTTYYIAVSGQNTGGGNFELCVALLGEQTPCVLNHYQRVTWRSNGGDLEGPFFPDEMVTICYTIAEYMPPPTECQWLQGVVPVFGNGWRVVPFNISGATLNGNNLPAPGVYGGEWNTYSNVLYNHTVPYLNVGDFDGNMTLDMCNSNYDPNCSGPGITGGLTNGQCWQGGTVLPTGWFCANRTDPCPDAGHPDVDWGDGEGCFGVQGPWEFCLDLLVMSYPQCEMLNDLTVTFFPLTHGEVGIAQNATSSLCANDQPSSVTYQGCCIEDGVFVENYPPFCTPGTFAYTPQHDGVDFWEWSVTPPDGVEGPENGSGPAGTTVFNTINNTGTTTEIVEYLFQGYSGGNCPSVLKTVFVIAYPELVVELDPLNACATPLTPYELTPNVSGGEGTTYSYEWFDGSTGETLLIADPDPGQLYSVTVTDVVGCTRESAITLNVYETFPVDIDASMQQQCFSDGPIDLNASAMDGTPGYTFDWTSPMGNNSSGSSIPALESGQWNVLVTDSQGCRGEDSVNLNFFESPTVTILPDIAEICPLNPEPEQITATAQGGMPPYFFQWQTPSGTSQNNFIFAEVTGQYTVEVTDFNGCTTQVVIDVGEAPYPTFDLGDDLTLCSDDLIVGYEVQIPDNSSYVLYNWSTGANTPSINVTQEGLYSVTVTNDQGCIGIEEVNIDTYDPIGDVFPYDTATFCQGGFAEIEGPFEYSYEWSTGSTGNPLIVVSDQSIVVTITDQNGCTTEDVIQVLESTSLLPNIQGDSIICNNVPVELQCANFAIVEWFDNPALIIPIQTGQNTLSVSSPGWYFVQVSDGNGCFGVDSIQVTESDLQVDITGDDAVCDGQSATLDAGTWPEIQWSTGESSQQITTDTAGTFAVTVTDNFGCSATGLFQVDVASSPQPDITGSQSFCTGSSTTLDAGGLFDSYEWSTGGTGPQETIATSGTVYLTVTNAEGCEGFDTIVVSESTELMPTITGDSTVCNGIAVVLNAGAGFATYEWTGGSAGQTLSVTAPGMYTVTVTDATGCSGTDAIEVIESSAQVIISGANAICDGEAATLTATAGFSEYEWSTQESSAEIIVTASGSYSLTVTDAQGCTGTAVFDLVVNSLPTVMISGSSTFCTGGSANLDAGDGFSNYNWSTGESTQTIQTSQAGVIVVTVTDVNGCTASDDLIISESNQLTPQITGDSLICNNAIAALNAGSGYATYAWSTGDGTQTISVTAAGTYVVTVTDNSGCSGSDSFDVNSGSAIVSISGTDELCAGETATLSATAGFDSYEWSTGDNTVMINVNATGSYLVTVTDQVGCTGTAEFDVNVNPLPSVNIMGSLSYCTGSSTTLDAGNGFTSYTWSTGGSNQTETINAPGSVFVTVTDANGCTGTDEVNIVEATELTLNVKDTSFCSGESVVLVVGTYSSYAWSDGSSTPTIQVSSAGSYGVTVSDVSGCTGTAAIEVGEVQPPSATVVDTVVCNTTAGGSGIDLNDLIVTGDMSGMWADLDNSGASGLLPMLDFEGVTPGVYRFEYITGSAQSPCLDQSYIIEIQVRDCACPSPALDNAPDLCDDNARIDLEDLFIAGVTDPGGIWTIVATPGGANPGVLSGSIFDATNADAGVYQIQYQIQGVPIGCPDVDVLNLTVQAAADAGTATGTAVVCVGDDSTLVLRDMIEGEDNGGVWVETSVVPSVAGFDAASGTFRTDLELPGTYLFDYVLSAQPPCREMATTIEIIIEDVPVADAGPDMSITCDAPTVEVGGAESSQGASYSYLWTTSNGEIQNPNELFTTIRDSGVYVLAVTNDLTGCVSYDEVVVDVIGAIPTGVEFDLNLPECEGDPAAAIKILNVTGGTPPYTYSLNGSVSSSGSSYTDLGPGEYILEVEDNEGCKYETVFIVPDENYLNASIAGDLDITRGQTSVVSYVLASGIVETAEWIDETGSVICANCDSIALQPVEDISLTLTLTDSNGCQIVLNTTIQVRINRDLFVPNVFSPNGDGVNDFITVYGEPGLRIEELSIFSRWGELLFETSDVPAGSPEQGWDGTMAGQQVMPGVYVYRASVRYVDGVEETVIGDLTLVK